MSVGLSGLLCVSRCVRSLLDLEQLQRASLLSGLHGLTALMKMGHITKRGVSTEGFPLSSSRCSLDAVVPEQLEVAC